MTPILLHADHVILMDQNNTVIPNGAVLVGFDRRKARTIAPHAGVVKRVLRLFDELVKGDQEGVLKEVREVVEGAEYRRIQSIWIEILGYTYKAA